MESRKTLNRYTNNVKNINETYMKELVNMGEIEKNIDYILSLISKKSEISIMRYMNDNSIDLISNSIREKTIKYELICLKNKFGHIDNIKKFEKNVHDNDDDDESDSDLYYSENEFDRSNLRNVLELCNCDFCARVNEIDKIWEQWEAIKLSEYILKSRIENMFNHHIHK